MKSPLRASSVLCLLLLASASVAAAQGWEETGPYVVKAMGNDYGQEGHERSDRARGVLYLPDADYPGATLDRFRVHFVRGEDGVVRLMQQGPDGTLVPIDTQGLPGDRASEHGRAIYVMDAAGNFYVIHPHWVRGPPGRTTLIHHSTIPAGRPVASAGFMEIVDGVLRSISNGSGHYSPENSKLEQARRALEAHGVPLDSYEPQYLGFEDRPGHINPITRRPNPMPARTEPEPPRTLTEDDARFAGLDDGDFGSLLGDDGDERIESRPAPPAPVEPQPDVAATLRQQILAREPGAMDVEFMKGLYAQHKDAGRIIAGIMSEPGMAVHSEAMGVLRQQMDDAVWKDVLSRHNIPIQITNQGRQSGIVSDLDYTLFYLADRYGIPIEDLIQDYKDTWQRMHQLDPARLEIEVMNGDRFYADFRNASLTYDEYRIQLVENLVRLRGQAEAYEVPGANKRQVHDRALLYGRTTQRRFDVTTGELVDAPVPTEEAWRYRHVSVLHDYRNALGVLIQEHQKFAQHDPTIAGNEDLPREAQRRAKHFNRVINDGLGNLGLFANTYREILDSNLPDDRKRAMKRDYLRRGLDPLRGGREGAPALTDAEIDRLIAIVDQSMAIERGAAPDFETYRAAAEESFRRLPGADRMTPAQQEAWKAAERARLFKEDQRALMFDALRAGLYYSSWRDLTPRGALRNAIRYEVDPRTGRTRAVVDLERLRKVVFERATEVLLMFEALARTSSPSERLAIGEEIFRGLPDELKSLFRQLAVVKESQVDNFLQDPDDPRRQAIEEHAWRLEDLLERKLARLREAGIEVVAAEEARRTVTDAEVEQRILDTRADPLNVYTQGMLFSALQVAKNSDPMVRHAFRNTMGLMMGSSVVSIVQAYQTGDSQLLKHALYSEALNYAPDIVALPFTTLDAIMRAQQGDISGLDQLAFLAMLRTSPQLGQFALVIGIGQGTFRIARTYAITRINSDLVEQAFRSRPVDELGNPLTGDVRARRNPWKDSSDTFRGDTPLYPLFYRELPVPEDRLTDAELFRMASVEMAPLIARVLDGKDLGPADSALMQDFGDLEPESEEWWQRARQLTEKYGFDLPYYARMRAMYQHYSPIVGRYIAEAGAAGRPGNEYVGEVALRKFMTEAVMSWYYDQPDGYRREFEGYFEAFFGNTEKQMLDLIIDHAIAEYYRQEELDAQARAAQEELEKEMEERVDAATTIEKQVVATERRLVGDITAGYEPLMRAAAEEGQTMLERDPAVVLDFPFTYATQVTLPEIEIDALASFSDFKPPICTRVTQEITGYTLGAPAGWRPEPEWRERFEPDASGVVRYAPVTVDHRFTVQLMEPANGSCDPLDARSRELASETLTLPVVYYEPVVPFEGSIAVRVLGATESGRPEDYFPYEGAIVTLGDRTAISGTYGSYTGWASFGELPAGTHGVTVAPRVGDERHGEASASATLVDSIATGAAGIESATVEVVLPYIPPPPPQLAQNPPDRQGVEGGGGGQPPAGGGQPPVGGGGQPPVGGGGEPDSLGGSGGQPDSLGAGGAGGGQPGAVGANAGDDAPEFADLCDALIVRPGEQPQTFNSSPVICSLYFRFPGTPKTFTLNVQRYDLPEHACAAMNETRNNMRRESRAVFEDIGQRYGREGFEARYGKYFEVSPSTGARIAHHSTFQVSFCRPPFYFDATVRYNGEEGAPVPDDVVADMRSRAEGTVEKLGGAPATAAAGAQDPEAALVESLGPGPLDTLREVNHLLRANGPLELLQSPGATGDRRRLLDRIGKSPDSMTADEKRIYASFAWMAALANAADVNGRRAFPGVNASLSILLGLATTALTDSDPSRAHQAATAMERYSAFLRRLDVQALQERHAP